MFDRWQTKGSLLHPFRCSALLGLLVFAAGAAASGSPDRVVLWRFVGELPDQDVPCPAPQNPAIWSGETFDVRGRRFCVYTAPNGSAADIGPALHSLQPPGAWTNAPQPDAIIVRPMASLSSFQWENLQARFEHQAGALDLPRTEGHTPVRIALIDSTPSGETPSFENSTHGESLGLFLRHFLCSDPTRLETCLFEPHPELALGFTEYDTEVPASWNEDHGGYVGLLSELALAIDRALENADGANLILNLSVAWDDELSPGDSAPERMVRAVLEKAACDGALVLAAAGNRHDDIDATGPLLPAAWEEEPVPAECAMSDPEEGSVYQYQPLVYAVGGVENNDLPLPVSRHDSQPPLVAYGESAVVEILLLGEPTATLSGTSVSAVVASMAAASIWYYFPNWSRPQVMNALYESAAALGGPPSFSACSNLNGCVRPTVRRVRLCDAVEWACSQEVGCPLELLQPGLCGDEPSWIPPEPNLTPVFEVGESVVNTVPQECAAGVYSYDPLGWPPPLQPPPFCPSRSFPDPGLLNGVAPQPNSDPCPDCTMYRGPLPGSNESLNIEIPGNFGFDVCSMTLERCGSFHVINLAITQGNQAQIQVPPVPGCNSATLQFDLVEEGDPCALFPSVASGLSGVTVVP